MSDEAPFNYRMFVELRGIRGERESLERQGIFHVQEVPGFGARVLSENSAAFLTTTPYAEVMEQLRAVDEHSTRINTVRDVVLGERKQREAKP